MIDLENDEGEIESFNWFTRVAGLLPVDDPLCSLFADPTDLGCLVTREEENIVARTRFFDVHPFLDVEDFVTADRITIGEEVLGPLAGNLRVSGATFALDQLQVGYREGVVTGQLIVERRAAGPQVYFRGNVTGVRPAGSDEVLDANAALSFAPRTLAMDGRVGFT